MPTLSVTTPRRPESGPLVHARSVGAHTAHGTTAGEMETDTDPQRPEFLDSSAAHVPAAANRRIREAGRRLIVTGGSAEVEGPSLGRSWEVGAR